MKRPLLERLQEQVSHGLSQISDDTEFDFKRRVEERINQMSNIELIEAISLTEEHTPE